MRLIVRVVIFIALKLWEVLIYPILFSIKWCIAQQPWDSRFIDFFRFNILKVFLVILGICMGFVSIFGWCAVWVATCYALFMDYSWILIFKDCFQESLPPNVALTTTFTLSAFVVPGLLALAIRFRGKLRSWIKDNWEQAEMLRTEYKIKDMLRKWVK